MEQDAFMRQSHDLFTKGDLVLYTPPHCKGNRMHKDVLPGIVSEVRRVSGGSLPYVKFEPDLTFLDWEGTQAVPCPQGLTSVDEPTWILYRERLLLLRGSRGSYSVGYANSLAA